VVAVQVRQHDQVDRRQLGELQRRLGQPLGPQAVAEVGPLTAVQEVRVGEDVKPP
jgi:hypothetical protein